MNKFIDIQKKLQNFVKKFYTNEIIKGSILFLTFGLLYFLFTLFLEYFLWLKPLARTFLFWFFILVEITLLIKFILFPVLKLIGVQKGISFTEASKIIGSHFKEVDDKLLNILQLHENEINSDLLIASIDQKAENLQPIPFRNAVNFKSNKKFLKYLFIPVIIWIFIYISGNVSFFTQSFDRVVHHKIAYVQPAPFTFSILNNSLQTIEGKSFVLKVLTEGKLIPEDLKIKFNGESYYFKSQSIGSFSYEFENPMESVEFIIEANGFESIHYVLDVINIPRVIDLEMFLNYPSYTGLIAKEIRNTGNSAIPEGTNVTWKIFSKNTSDISLIRSESDSLIKNNEANRFSFEMDGKNHYELVKTITKNLDYVISTSNKELINYENLEYHLKVLKDEYPKIIVKSNIDSARSGPIQFIGQLSDDFGLTKLQITSKSLNDETLSVYMIQIGKSNFEEFFYVFPEGLFLEEGSSYEIYFEVFDNDGINGSKKGKSQKFYYKNKNELELNQNRLLEQKEILSKMESSAKSSKDVLKSLEKLSNKLKRKDQQNWNDKNELNNFFQRQIEQQKILNENSKNILQNLNEFEEEASPDMREKNEQLKRRIEETNELFQKEKLLSELQELTKKLEKEGMLQNVDKLNSQMKQETKSLERILELTKRFYVDKKTSQIISKLEELSNEQFELSGNESNKADNQKKLNTKFDSIQKDLDELKKENNELIVPKDIPNLKSDEEKIKLDMKDAEINLNMEENSNSDIQHYFERAEKSQKAAARKMRDLSEKMKSSMRQMEMKTLDENIDDLKQILDNLILFSFEQEEVMISLENVDSKNADYPNKLRRQQVLKEYFEHIDDSLYTLSLRMVDLSVKIQAELVDAHYNLDKSLEKIADNDVEGGISNQQYTMTAVNNLADLLSDMLQNLQNKKSGNGMGNGKEGESISLPDIIMKQKKLLESSKEGMKSQNVKGSKSKEQMSGEQFRLFQEQMELREQLNELLNNQSINAKKGADISEQMQNLEKLLLEKGVTNDVLKLMEKLEYELLQLEDASSDQNRSKQRNSETNFNNFKMRAIRDIPYKKIFFNENEILNRQELPLNSFFKFKVNSYFQGDSIQLYN